MDALNIFLAIGTLKELCNFIPVNHNVCAFREKIRSSVSGQALITLLVLRSYWWARIHK